MDEPRRGAGAVALGLLLTIVAAALLLTAGYLGLTNPTEYQDDPRPGVPFAWAGWVCLAVGAPALAAGAWQALRR